MDETLRGRSSFFVRSMHCKIIEIRYNKSSVFFDNQIILTEDDLIHHGKRKTYLCRKESTFCSKG